LGCIGSSLSGLFKLQKRCLKDPGINLLCHTSQLHFQQAPHRQIYENPVLQMNQTRS
jgi:hypothetical protein